MVLISSHLPIHGYLENLPESTAHTYTGPINPLTSAYTVGKEFRRTFNESRNFSWNMLQKMYLT
jgi:hypothetical protein